jgi:hypothetical protein
MMKPVKIYLKHRKNCPWFGEKHAECTGRASSPHQIHECDYDECPILFWVKKFRPIVDELNIPLA